MYLLLLCPHPLFFHCQYLGIETIATFISECHFIRLLPYLPEHFIPIHQTWSDSFLVFFFFFIILILPLMSVFLTRWIQPSKNSIWPCLAFTFWGLKDEPSDVCAYNEVLKEILNASEANICDLMSWVLSLLVYYMKSCKYSSLSGAFTSATMTQPRFLVNQVSFLLYLRVFLSLQQIFLDCSCSDTLFSLV